MTTFNGRPNCDAFGVVRLTDGGETLRGPHSCRESCPLGLMFTTNGLDEHERPGDHGRRPQRTRQPQCGNAGRIADARAIGAGE